MNIDKDVFAKGVKTLIITIFLMFTAPIVLWQAFKNSGHPFYWPVLIVGIILAILAIGMGFKGISTIMNAIFGHKKKPLRK